MTDQTRWGIDLVQQKNKQKAFEHQTEMREEIKAYRNDMVARNYPFQQISDIITKWENKLIKENERREE